jgi:hypothetical protein
MKEKLIKAGLLRVGETFDTEPDISSAWSILSRLGYPSRYGGKTQDGYREYLITDPTSGTLLTSGKGRTLESAMCQAALSACDLSDSTKKEQF